MKETAKQGVKKVVMIVATVIVTDAIEEGFRGIVDPIADRFAPEPEKRGLNPFKRFSNKKNSNKNSKKTNKRK